MKGILEFFEGIKDGIVTAYEYLVGVIEDIAYMVKLLAGYVDKIPDWFDWLPAEVLYILLTIVAVVVIYKILGREG